MKIDNGRRARLIIEGVFDGDAGLSRGLLAFRPNRSTAKPDLARGATLDGEPILIAPRLDQASGYWLTSFTRP